MELDIYYRDRGSELLAHTDTFHSPVPDTFDLAIITEVLNDAFEAFNLDHEYDSFRSMSVGDVAVYGELAFLCDDFGWTPVRIERVHMDVSDDVIRVVRR